MKAGTRALGVAESFGSDAERSTLCGAVVRADRVVDGFAYETCRVGGADATDAIRSLFRALGREDVRHLLVAGIAPAWYNLVDLHGLHEAVGIPVLSVSFEESEGLEPALRREFEGAALDRRRDTYRAQPPRRPVDVNDGRVFVRAVGCDDETAARVVRAHTPAGSRRPEPLRVARLAARAADGFRRTHDA